MEATTVVIDNGSYMCKAGFAGQDSPTFEFHSTVGLHRYFKNTLEVTRFKDSYVGDDAYSKRSVLNLKYPIKRGIITNWDDMEKVS